MCLLWYTVLASDPCTCFFDGYKVKMTGKNRPNHTIKEEMHGQLNKKWEKHGQLSNPSWDSAMIYKYFSLLLNYALKFSSNVLIIFQ